MNSTGGLNPKGCGKKHTQMKSKKHRPLMTRKEFDQIMLANQETLRQDPFGVEASRKSCERIRRAVEELKAQAAAAKKKRRK